MLLEWVLLVLKYGYCLISCCKNVLNVILCLIFARKMDMTNAWAFNGNVYFCIVW